MNENGNVLEEITNYGPTTEVRIIQRCLLYQKFFYAISCVESLVILLIVKSGHSTV
jgi:hypothetical protein